MKAKKDNALFNFELGIGINFVNKDTHDSGVEDTEDKILRIYKEKVFKTISNILEIGLPKPGEQLRVITKKSFNAISLITHIIEKEGDIEDAVFVVY